MEGKEKRAEKRAHKKQVLKNMDEDFNKMMEKTIDIVKAYLEDNPETFLKDEMRDFLYKWIIDWLRSLQKEPELHCAHYKRPKHRQSNPNLENHIAIKWAKREPIFFDNDYERIRIKSAKIASKSNSKQLNDVSTTSRAKTHKVSKSFSEASITPIRFNKFRTPKINEIDPLDKESKSVNIDYYDSEGCNLFVNKSTADISIDLSLDVSVDKPNN